MAQSLFKPFPCNLLATKVQSFPRKSSNTASPMIACRARDFTWNQGWSSNSPPPGRLMVKFPPPRDGKGVKCTGYARGGGCWSFDLTDALLNCNNTKDNFLHEPEKINFKFHRNWENTGKITMHKDFISWNLRLLMFVFSGSNKNLFFGVISDTYYIYLLITQHCMILHYNKLQIHYITLHYEL